MRNCEGWEQVTNQQGKEALRREFQFTDFKEAFSVMTRIALKAEEMGHHPEWFNVYNRLNVELTTHDTGGISDKDYEMAEFINSVLPG